MPLLVDHNRFLRPASVLPNPIFHIPENLPSWVHFLTVVTPDAVTIMLAIITNSELVSEVSITFPLVVFLNKGWHSHLRDQGEDASATACSFIPRCVIGTHFKSLRCPAEFQCRSKFSVVSFDAAPRCFVKRSRVRKKDATASPTIHRLGSLYLMIQSIQIHLMALKIVITVTDKHLQIMFKGHST